MKVGFVFTNYNNSSYTRAAVASLRSGTRWNDVRIVVVDNKSQEADVEAVKQIARDYPEIQLLLNPENVGYFRGLNTGIRHLRQSCPDVDTMVVGNNDLEFPGNFVQTVLESRDLFDQWAVLAPDLVTTDGVHQNPHMVHPIGRVRKFIWDLYFLWYPGSLLIRLLANLTRTFTRRQENDPSSQLYKTAGPIEQGYGACYILGPLFFRSFTELCAPSFLMQEEFFLAEQLRSAGQRIYYDPRFVVCHHHHATMSKLPTRRHWTISRDAHRLYKRFLKMSAEEQSRVIANLGGGPGDPDAMPESGLRTTH